MPPALESGDECVHPSQVHPDAGGEATLVLRVQYPDFVDIVSEGDNPAVASTPYESGPSLECHLVVQPSAAPHGLVLLRDGELVSTVDAEETGEPTSVLEGKPPMLQG